MALLHESGRLAALTTEGADDPHAAEDLGRPRVDLLPTLADVAEERPELHVPEPVREDYPGRQADPPQHQPPVEQGQRDPPAGELNDRPPGVVQHAEDQLSDPAGVLADEARTSPRIAPTDPVQRRPGRVLEDP